MTRGKLFNSEINITGKAQSLKILKQSVCVQTVKQKSLYKA